MNQENVTMKSDAIDIWKEFLAGRIEQEKGNHEEALKYFESVLKADPNNPSFLRAKANALKGLKKPKEALMADVVAEYRELAQTHIGEMDKPDLWIRGLEGILAKIESFEKDTATAMLASAW